MFPMSPVVRSLETELACQCVARPCTLQNLCDSHLAAVEVTDNVPEGAYEEWHRAQTSHRWDRTARRGRLVLRSGRSACPKSSSPCPRRNGLPAQDDQFRVHREQLTRPRLVAPFRNQNRGGWTIRILGA